MCSRIHSQIGIPRKGEPVIENKRLLQLPRKYGKMRRAATSVQNRMCWVSNLEGVAMTSVARVSYYISPAVDFVGTLARGKQLSQEQFPFCF